MWAFFFASDMKDESNPFEVAYFGKLISQNLFYFAFAVHCLLIWNIIFGMRIKLYGNVGNTPREICVTVCFWKSCGSKQSKIKTDLKDHLGKILFWVLWAKRFSRFFQVYLKSWYLELSWLFYLKLHQHKALKLI